MYDKLIHKDEFRLRILVTNDCDKDCDFCLNDFQPKEPVAYANMFDVADCLRAYGSFMKSLKDKSIVTFSGGEPGLHPGLEFMLINAKQYCKIVKVVTNGRALNPKLVDFVDVWHVGVTDKDQTVIDFLQYSKNITVQIVVTKNTTYFQLRDIIRYYLNQEIKVKLFSNFSEADLSQINYLISVMQHKFPSLETRFTGKQTNRGVACSGCERKCVTLKALWVFPDGKSSTCPQGVGRYFDDDSWDETVEQAYNAHMSFEGSDKNE